MSSYRIEITSRAYREFKKLDPKVKKVITKAILKLEKERTPQQFKPLIGRTIAQYRLRVGDYRILYDVYDDDKVVLIVKIGHRKEIYR